MHCAVLDRCRLIGANATGALNVLCVGGQNCMELVRQGAIDVILASMSAHPACVELQCDAFSILHRLYEKLSQQQAQLFVSRLASFVRVNHTVDERACLASSSERLPLPELQTADTLAQRLRDYGRACDECGARLSCDASGLAEACRACADAGVGYDHEVSAIRFEADESDLLPASPPAAGPKGR